jgi:tetratricopeptide (TPR) repeat protein
MLLKTHRRKLQMKRTLILLVTLSLAASATSDLFAAKKTEAKNEANELARKGTEAARNRQWDEAIEDLRKAAGMDKKYSPSLLAALLGRAATYASQQQWQQAAADYDEVLKLDNRNVTALEGRGSTAMKMNDMDKALAMYSEAIKVNPKEIRYLQYRAYIYEVKGDLKNSMADNDKILKLEPNNPDAVARKQRLDTRIAQEAANGGAAPQPTP